MKKIFLLVFVLSFLVPVFAFASFNVSLKYGSRGDAVIELQDFLQDQGVYSGTIDGRFGLGTRKAVIAFQLANGLKGDGYFGLASRAKAGAILALEVKPSIDAEQAEISTTTPTVAGCTSTSAYSPTTGQPCNVATQQNTQQVPQNIPLTVPSSSAPIASPATGSNSASVAGNSQIAQPEVLAVWKNTTYADTSVNSNTANAKIGSFMVQNQSLNSSLRVTNLSVSLIDSSGAILTSSSTPALADFSNLRNSGDPVNLAPGQAQRIDVFADMGFVVPNTRFSTKLIVTYGNQNGEMSATGQTITIR